MTSFYLKYIGGLSNLAKLFESSSGRKGTDIFLLFFLLAWYIALFVWFYFIPLTITKFNRNKQTVSQIKYSIFGKRTREFGYSYVQGGVREKIERSSKSSHSSLYFETQTGEK